MRPCGTRSAAWTAALVLLAGCASSPGTPPSVQTGPHAEVTPEGLHKVDDSRVGVAFVKPDADFSVYRKVMLPPIAITFHEDSRVLEDEHVATMKELFYEAFEEEVDEGGGYEITSEPGPDVLLIRAALVDVLVTVPPEPISRGAIIVDHSGFVTLGVELRDSTSGELLARAADRRPVEGPGGWVYRANRFNNVHYTRRLFEAWASLLRESLDEAHARSPGPS